MAVGDLKAISEYMQSQAGEDAAINSKDVIDVDSLIELISSKSPGRPSNKMQFNNSQDNDLSKQLQRLRREKEDDQSYFDSEIRKLKRQLQSVSAIRDELDEQVRDVQNQKKRLEDMFKNGLANGGSQQDIMLDFKLMMSRLEFLEKQSHDRNISLIPDQAPVKREVMRLKQELNEEREIREKVVKKKNAEIMYFKKELDELLQEIQSKANVK